MARANSPGGKAGSWILASERSMRANFHWLTAICSTRDFSMSSWGIQADAGLARGSLGAGRSLRIAPVSPYLIDSSHSYLFYRTKPIWGGTAGLEVRGKAI